MLSPRVGLRLALAIFANAYQYQIKFKSDLNKIADTTVPEIQISGVAFKATGYNAVTLLKASKPDEILGYSFGYEKEELNPVENDSTSFSPIGGKVNVVASLKDKNGKDVAALEVTVNSMTYTLTKGMKFYALDTAITFDPAKDKGLFRQCSSQGSPR